MRRSLTITSLIFLAGCREAAPPPPLEYVFDTVGSIQRMRISGTPPTWSLDKVFEVGTGDSGVNSFGRVRSVLIDTANTLWVADAGDARILHFSPDGTPLTPIGRSGAGPGEFREPYSVVQIQNGLAVLDPMGSRVGIFGFGGGWGGEKPAPRLTGGKDIRLYPVTVEQAWMLGYRINGEELERTWVAFPGTGAATDTILAVPPPKGGPAYHLACQIPAGGLALFSAPFAPISIRHPLDVRGTTLAVDESAYRLTLVDPAGDTIRIVERELAPLPISDEEWEEGNAEYSAFRAKHPDAVCEPATMTRPATKSAILGIWSTIDGRLWVHARTAAGEVFDLYARSGKLMGSMPAPALSDDAAPSAYGDRLALPSRDDDGRPIVTVYRVIAPPPVRDTTARALPARGPDRPVPPAP